MARYITTLGYQPPTEPRVLLVIEDHERGAAIIEQLRGARYRMRAVSPSRLELMFAAEVPELVVIAAELGAQICSGLKQAHPALPIVVVAGDRMDAIRAGADHWMPDPIDTGELVARATWLLDHAGRHRAIASKVETLRLWYDWVRYLVHDLRTPTTIAMATVSLAQRSNADAEVAKELAEAEGALADIANMLSDVLDSNRLKHGVLVPNRQPVDLGTLAGRIASSLSRPVDVTTKGDTTLDVDPELIARVFSNLIANANRHARRMPVRVEVTGTSHGVSARIINDGAAVAPELQPYLFEPWKPVAGGYRAGTGIGLAFCRLVCEAHDGKIWLDSAAAGAVTFAFGIPRAARPEAR